MAKKKRYFKNYKAAIAFILDHALDYNMCEIRYSDDEKMQEAVEEMKSLRDRYTQAQRDIKALNSEIYALKKGKGSKE